MRAVIIVSTEWVEYCIIELIYFTFKTQAALQVISFSDVMKGLFTSVNFINTTEEQANMLSYDKNEYRMKNELTLRVYCHTVAYWCYIAVG